MSFYLQAGSELLGPEDGTPLKAVRSAIQECTINMCSALSIGLVLLWDTKIRLGHSSVGESTDNLFILAELLPERTVLCEAFEKALKRRLLGGWVRGEKWSGTNKEE